MAISVVLVWSPSGIAVGTLKVPSTSSTPPVLVMAVAAER